MQLIGIWLISEWSKCGKPKPLQIAELGPGRGTLMSDILRVFSKFKIAESELTISLVEVSPFLTEFQEKTLCGNRKISDKVLSNDSAFSKESISVYGQPVRWYSNLSDLPHSFTLYVAHEFFDALPIHKLVKTEQGWREILIDINPSDFSLRYVMSRDRTPASLYCRVRFLFSFMFINLKNKPFIYCGNI